MKDYFIKSNSKLKMKRHFFMLQSSIILVMLVLAYKLQREMKRKRKTLKYSQFLASTLATFSQLHFKREIII